VSAREGRHHAWLAIAVPPAIGLIVFLAIFEAVARVFFADAAYLLPPPSAIVRAAWQERALLASATLATARTSVLGFVASGVLGVASAVALSSSRLAERALYPYAIALQTVPIVAIAPLLVVWLGAGPRSVIAAAFIVSLFPVLTNTLAGLRGVDPALRDLFRLYGASRLATLTKLSLPAATPSIAVGLRVSAGLAVIGAIVGEFVAGFAERDPGLGIVVMTAYRQLRTDLLFAAVAGSALLGITLFLAVSLAAWIVLRNWYVGAR
jgi:NitT/TauT family transport system permease protein